MTVADTLQQGLKALGLQVDGRTCERALAYLHLLEKWNRIHNLTAIRGLEAMLTQHVLDSAAVVPHLQGATVVDVGSGGGLPGIPIALLCPERRVTLLESNHKKAAFLRQATIELALTNVVVVCERAEAWHPEALYHAVISRAFAELAQFVAAAGHLCGPEGTMYAMKGVYPHEELTHLPPDCHVAEVRALSVPGLPAQRHLVVLRPQPATARSI